MRNGYIMWSWKHDSHHYIIISASHALIKYTEYGENCAGVCVFVILKGTFALKSAQITSTVAPPSKNEK